MRRTRDSQRLRGILVWAVLVSFLAGCFTFTDGDKEGFRVSAVFDGDGPTRIGPCSRADMNSALGVARDSFDEPDDPGAGSLRMQLAGTCFPPEASSGFARFDFVSPTLRDWDDATGYMFVAKANAPGIWIQALMVVRNASGEIVTLRDVDESGVVFHELEEGRDWAVIQFPRPGDGSERVLGVKIRVFIDNETLAAAYPGYPEAVLQVDAIAQLR